MRNEREHTEQCFAIFWCELNKEKYPCLGRIYAIPNMGKHHVSFRVKQAKEGLKKGMLDLCLPWPKVTEIEINGQKYFSKVVHGLYIEMKIRPNGLSPEQKEWKEYFNSVGYETHVAWSGEQCIDILKNYVNPDETKWRNFLGK